MRPFSLARAADLPTAQRAALTGAALIAGGTNLLDLMKLQIATPDVLIDLGPIAGLDRITPMGQGLRIGALVRNADLAAHPEVCARYPVLSRALLAGASGQIRNMASTAGNLLQRTRCPYFYDTAMACNKRAPGAGCAAQGGYARMLAILGTSPDCRAAHPSDMAVALRALDARIEICSPNDQIRVVAMDDLYRLPGDTPHLDTTLAAGDVITAVILPETALGARHSYRKVRDRASYAFALVSVAAVVRMDADRIAHAGLAFGGVGTRPWADASVEAMLRGQVPSEALFHRAAAHLLRGAVTDEGTAFKPALLTRALVATLKEVTGMVPMTTGTDLTGLGQ